MYRISITPGHGDLFQMQFSPEIWVSHLDLLPLAKGYLTIHIHQGLPLQWLEMTVPHISDTVNLFATVTLFFIWLFFFGMSSGAIIRDGDRKRGVHASPCVVPKKLFLEKIAPPFTS